MFFFIRLVPVSCFLYISFDEYVCVMDRHRIPIKYSLYIKKSYQIKQKNVSLALLLALSVFHHAPISLSFTRMTERISKIFHARLVVVVGNERMDRSLRFYHFFLCSSIETPPGPRDTIISNPPITDNVWKKSYFKKSRNGL